MLSGFALQCLLYEIGATSSRSCAPAYSYHIISHQGAAVELRVGLEGWMDGAETTARPAPPRPARTRRAATLLSGSFRYDSHLSAPCVRAEARREL